MISNLKNRKRIYLVVVFAMIVVSMIFVNSFYWPHRGIGERKIVVGIVVSFLITFVPLLSISLEKIYDRIKVFVLKIITVIITAKNNKKNTMICGFSIVAVVIISWFITSLLCNYILQKGFNIKLYYTVLAIESIIFAGCYAWNIADKKPEIIYIIIALIMGVFSIAITPDRTGISWDDQIHYDRALELSNVLNGIMYKADEMNINDVVKNTIESVGFDRQSDMAYKEQMESLYEAKELTTHEFTYYNVTSISSIPSALGIIMGRGLGLSYFGVFNMGRFFNLLTYVILIYFAIKRINYGKLLIATIGLIPTTIFMASNYSYDSWVIGFTILGLSYFFAELQEDTKIQTKNIIIMIGAIALGCLPKAIYFPILFPLLFMPQSKFKSKKQRNLYYLGIVIAGLFIIATFLLPMLIEGAGTGDARGGSEVNASEQIKYILSNPIDYMKILFNFEMDYLSMGSIGPSLQMFAYVGNGRFYGIVASILTVMCFLDRGKDEKNYLYVKGACIIANIGMIILATTALYIDFTAVASTTVAGMSPRYVFPTLYLALYALGSGGITHNFNKKAFSYIPMAIIAVTFIFNMWMACGIRYY